MVSKHRFGCAQVPGPTRRVFGCCCTVPLYRMPIRSTEVQPGYQVFGRSPTSKPQSLRAVVKATLYVGQTILQTNQYSTAQYYENVESSILQQNINQTHHQRGNIQLHLMPVRENTHTHTHTHNI